MKISMGKKYKTRSGLPVEIITVDGRSEFPVIGYIEDDNALSCWRSDGKHGDSDVLDEYDLVEVSPYADFKKDDPVMVRDGNDRTWKKRHFAYEENGVAYCYKDGCTSWTDKAMTQVRWEECRKPTEEELNNA